VSERPDAMSCAEAEPLLPLVADGAVDPDSDPALFAHLSSCPDCQRAVAAHDLIGLAIARSAPLPLPRRQRAWRWLPAAAAASLAAAAGLWLLAGDRTPGAPMPLAEAVAPAAAPAPPAVSTGTPTIAVAGPLAGEATPAPEVIAVPDGAGGRTWLVRRGDTWVRLDTDNMDAADQPTHGAVGGVQVRH
jgi:hypothetical protein